MRRFFSRVLPTIGLHEWLVWESGWSLVLKAAYTGLTFLSTVLLARLLGPKEYGIYAYTYSLVTILAVPVQAGLPRVIMRETARGVALCRSDLVRGLWRWSGWFVGVLSILLVGLAFLLLLMRREMLHASQLTTYAWALALVPLMAGANLRGAALRGLKRIVAGQLPEFVIMPATFVILLIWKGVLADRTLSAAFAMCLRVSSALIAFVCGAWMLWRNTPESIRQATPRFLGKPWLLSSLLFGFITGFQVINRRMGTAILGLYAPSEQVGAYQVAMQLSMLASFGLHAMNMVLAPRFADLHARGDQRGLQRLATIGARLALAFNLIITAILLIIGKPFLAKVFGSGFETSYAPLTILLIGQMVNSMVGSVGILVGMTGHEISAVGAFGAAAIVNVAIGIWLIPLWQTRGAAVAAIASMTVWNGVLFWKARTNLGVNSTIFSFLDLADGQEEHQSI